MSLDPLTAKLIVDVIGAILPFGHIARAWSNYLHYKAKKLEISYKIKELEAKVPLAKEYIRSHTEIQLERLRNERHSFDKRIAILQGQLTGSNLNRAQISCVIETLTGKLNEVHGDDLKYVTQAISHLSSCLTSQTTSIFDLLGKEVSLQMSSIKETLHQYPQIDSGKPLIEGS